MNILKDQFPVEDLKRPPEIKETVDEVLEKVEEYAIKYA